jgi:periplasmic divalent cation tolerance protein
MNGEPDVLVVLVTAPAGDVASSLAKTVVEDGHAACVNILPGATSVYRWEGQICEEVEALLVIKTTVSCWPSLMARIRDAHPYDVPEVIALPVVAGLEAYLGWVRGAVTP